jgi:hypothetical protein
MGARQGRLALQLASNPTTSVGLGVIDEDGAPNAVNQAEIC